ncbi:Gb:AAD25142.1-like protein [Theobroma cacao]|uniref:Gb:AAD25142.1-like protein n=1 Tax=Theobroma cacao TaxID=3641 RepID=A0A061GNT2_THECC|nr:Gb:AAD25142.1-like protein [Theobroma cacao]
MASSFCLSLSPPSKTLAPPSTSSTSTSPSRGCRCYFVVSGSNGIQLTRRRRQQVVCMAPEEEKLTRRNPLDFPIEWERPKPGRRPDIFPQFSPMKTILEHGVSGISYFGLRGLCKCLLGELFRSIQGKFGLNSCFCCVRIHKSL